MPHPGPADRRAITSGLALTPRRLSQTRNVKRATLERERELEDAIGALRPEILAHCYRMLGSLCAAEDALQDALTRAWSARSRFEGRAAVRTWLYRIATNVCFDALSERGRRTLPECREPARRHGIALAAGVGEPIWLEPIPDAMIGLDPEARLAERQQVALAFIAALQRLTPRQRAVLLLRDVIAWKASEVAELLGSTVDSIESALHRARALAAREAPLEPTGPQERALLRRYLAAWQAGDWRALAGMLSEDAVFAMPPIPTWFCGPARILRFLEGAHVRAIFADGCQLAPVHANGGPAFLVRRAGHPHAVQLVGLRGGRVATIHNFNDPQVLRRFAGNDTGPARDQFRGRAKSNR